MARELQIPSEIFHVLIPKVLVVGEFFVDEIFSDFPSLPRMGEESFARQFQREIGGGAAITACALAKLGLRVSVLGVVGKDGTWLTNRLSSFGVDCEGLERHPAEPTGLTASVSTREDRAFFTYYGANQRLPQMLAKPETLRSIRSADHVHFACAPDAEFNMNLFPARGHRKFRVSIDVQSHTTWLERPQSLQILRRCDIFFPNERESEHISGTSGVSNILDALRQKGLRGVGLKLGAQGAALLWKNREFMSPTMPVETVDTTGAGDCFNAGFIYAWLRGEKPQMCLEVANICGALSTRELGGIAGFPTLQELQKYEAALTEKQ